MLDRSGEHDRLEQAAALISGDAARELAALEATLESMRPTFSVTPIVLTHRPAVGRIETTTFRA